MKHFLAYTRETLPRDLEDDEDDDDGYDYDYYKRVPTSLLKHRK